MKRIISLALCLVLCLLAFTGCGKKEESSNNFETLEGHPHVKVLMDTGSSFTIELYPEFAPETCSNFVNLVKSGFYNGLTFHRVVDNFMAQGGSSDGKGVKGSDTRIKGEFAANGFTQNTMKHERGVVSMARTSDNFDSASSQFFVCYTDCSFLDGQYAAFGKVIEGMETVDKFREVERTSNGFDSTPSTPVKPIVIASMELVEN